LRARRRAAPRQVGAEAVLSVLVASLSVAGIPARGDARRRVIAGASLL